MDIPLRAKMPISDRGNEFFGGSGVLSVNMVVLSKGESLCKFRYDSRICYICLTGVGVYVHVCAYINTLQKNQIGWKY